MVREIHNAVKGRIRYKVQGLYRSETLKRDLESRLLNEEDITHASAGLLTGNILVVFDPQCNPRKIASIIESVAVACFQRRGKPVPDAASRTRDQRMDDKRDWSKGEKTGSVRLRTPVVAASREQRTEIWHLMEAGTVLDMMNSSPKTGLTKETAAESLKNYGLNVVPERGARSKLGMFIDQFLSVPVYLLAGAAGLSLLTGGVIDAAVIMSVVGLNAVIGYLTESAAEKTISSLKQLVRPSAQLIRDGEMVELPSEEVLVGDILALRPGVYVTADARLVEAVHLSLDESVLTGESMPVTKTADTLYGKDIPLADRVNMVYSGTLVTGGQGFAVVVAIGSYSEIGRVQALVAGAEAPETPVEKQLGTIGNQLVAMSAGVCALIFFIGLLRGNGFIEMLKTAVSLAVAAVPEGLPAVATTTLALGVRNMRRHRVLIRKLEAVTTLGSVETICFDKTGTITLNRMSVLKVHAGMRLLDVRDGSFTMGDTHFNPYTTADELLRLIHVCTLCNESEVSFDNSRCVVNGSATENALIHMAVSCGVDVQDLRGKYRLLKTNYRTETCRFMSTLHSQNGDGQLLAVKGGPVDVLNMCSDHVVNGEKVTLSDDERELIEFENDRMAGDALRVLGVAYAPDDPGDLSSNGNGLTWLGLVGMADPIRDRVKEAIGVFQKAGLNTIMITGDQSATAYAVGRALNLSNGRPIEILDSSHVADADPAMMKSLCRNVHVFSRVSPSHKLQIVQALQSTGKVVAMTGDGINDGPALKAADIGIAMGRSGTEVAREVADVVLEQDDLETLIVALSDGRTIYNNIRKTLHYLLATNFSEILVMFSAGALGLGHPLNAMQLLWINLVTDVFPGLALALEPPEPDVLSWPPRPSDEPIVKVEDYKRITFEASAITCASLASYGYGLLKYGAGASAGTLAFQTLTTSQILHALTCRSETRSIFDKDQPPPNKYLTMAVVLSLGFQLLSQLVPGLRNLLGATPITLADGAVIGVTSVLPMLITEAAKMTARERVSEPPAEDLPGDVVHGIQ
ncbi:MAG: HAD-IC family P-type ATPase [Pseudomonadota bacterium]